MAVQESTKKAGVSQKEAFLKEADRRTKVIFDKADVNKDKKIAFEGKNLKIIKKRFAMKNGDFYAFLQSIKFCLETMKSWRSLKRRSTHPWTKFAKLI